MANDCSGTVRVVAKSKETLDRLVKIMNYEDDEFFVSRCRGFEANGDAVEDDGFFVQDFSVDGAWNCARFFETDENEKELIVTGYEKNERGSSDFDKPIYGTAHLTNLVELAKKLGFGLELWSVEPGVGFTEHITLDHDGEYYCETGDYSAEYPLGEDGEPDEDAEPEEDYGFEDWGEHEMCSEEIYG